MKRTLAFLYVFTALSFISLLLTNCGGCSNRDANQFLTEARFQFEIINAKTGKNLFFNSAYPIDSVRLINSNTVLGKAKTGIQGEYSFDIDSIYTSQNQIGQRVERIYYLYLNQADTDTIRLSFLPVDGKCDPYFTDYQVFFNNRLVTSIQNTISFSTKINKP